MRQETSRMAVHKGGHVEGRLSGKMRYREIENRYMYVCMYEAHLSADIERVERGGS